MVLFTEKGCNLVASVTAVLSIDVYDKTIRGSTLFVHRSIRRRQDPEKSKLRTRLVASRDS
jgi:hypothetical protein